MSRAMLVRRLAWVRRLYSRLLVSRMRLLAGDSREESSEVFGHSFLFFCYTASVGCGGSDFATALHHGRVLAFEGKVVDEAGFDRRGDEDPKLLGIFVSYSLSESLNPGSKLSVHGVMEGSLVLLAYLHLCDGVFFQWGRSGF